MGTQNAPDEFGKIIGNVEIATTELLDPLKEVSLGRLPWRAALDLYLSNDLGDAPSGLITRIYAITLSSRTLIAQHEYFARSTGSHVATPQPNDPFGVAPRIARIRNRGCSEYEVCVIGGNTIGGGPGSKLKMNYCLWGCEPDSDPIPDTIWKQPFGSDNELLVLTGPGRLHKLWLTNLGPNDVWALLLDTSGHDPQRSGALTSPPDFPMMPPIFIPKNAQGATFLDFGHPGLWPRYGLTIVFTQTPAVVPYVFDNTAHCNYIAEIS